MYGGIVLAFVLVLVPALHYILAVKYLIGGT